MADMTYSTNYVREAPEIEAYKLGLIQEAQRLYNQPMNVPAVEAAGLSATQVQCLPPRSFKKRRTYWVALYLY